MAAPTSSSPFRSPFCCVFLLGPLFGTCCLLVTYCLFLPFSFAFLTHTLTQAQTQAQTRKEKKRGQQKEKRQDNERTQIKSQAVPSWPQLSPGLTPTGESGGPQDRLLSLDDWPMIGVNLACLYAVAWACLLLQERLLRRNAWARLVCPSIAAREGDRGAPIKKAHLYLPP